MSTIINARSPYFVKYEATQSNRTLVGVQVNVFIYSGVFGTDKPPTSDFYIEREIVSTNTPYIVIDIAEFIRDELFTKYYTSAIDAVWVELDAVITEFDNTVFTEQDDRNFLAFDGFGYFNEGSNPRRFNQPQNPAQPFTPQVLQDNHCIYFTTGRDIRIPLFSEPQGTANYIGGAGYWNETEYYWTAADVNWDGTAVSQVITDSSDSNDKIQYLILGAGQFGDGDTITIQSNVGSSQTTVLTLNRLQCGKFEKIRVVFYNKYGALQDIWVDKKSIQSIQVRDQEFKANILDYTTTIPSYDTNSHTKQRFDISANERIVCNTGFIGECMNDPIKQLLLSESVWLEFEDLSVVPVIVKTSSQQFKTGVNDKLIQYTFEFEYAFDTIQNVR
jgi:hypothetical protein